MNFRIRETDKGFIVERKTSGWFRSKWVVEITYRGSKDAFPFSTYQGAEDDLIMEVRKSTMNNSR